jgi:hypothetical protein
VPVSSPSEFPPHRANGTISGLESGKLATGSNCFFAGQNSGNNSTVNGLIMIGGLAAATQAITDSHLANSILIGSNLFPKIVGAFGGVTTTPSIIAIGANIGAGILNSESQIIIGQGILGTTNATSGNELFNNVLIGNQIGNSLAGSQALSAMVVIGQQALVNQTVGCNNSVVIGPQALAGGSPQSVQGSVFIGDSCLAANAASGCVVIGQTANANTTATTVSNAIVIGHSAAGGSNCIAIGALAAITNGSNNSVAIGAGALIPGTVGYTNSFILGTSGLTGGGGTLLTGRFDLGTLCVGAGATPANNFGLAGMSNTLGIMNGTAGSSNPVGGGYFYVVAGVLHWIDTGGGDTTLSSPGAPATGASTATFVATNKPGATTGAGPVAWENRVINGVSYQAPLWAT